MTARGFGAGVNRFNLTFSGVISAGRDPQRARARFAEIFDVEDDPRLEKFFSGDTIVLRRNLERKEAGEYYARMRRYGLEATLVKLPPERARAVTVEPATAAPAETSPRSAGSERQQPKEQARERKRQRKAAAPARKQARIRAKQRQRARAAEPQRHQTAPEAPASSEAPAAPSAAVAETDPPAAGASAPAAPPPALAKPPARKHIRSAIDLSGLRRSSGRAAGRREAPNAYRLQPFRNSPAIRQRAQQADLRLRRGLLTAAGAIAVLLMLLGSFIAQRPTPAPAGPAAIAAASDGKLYVLVADKLLQHDRAGVPESAIALEEFGLADPGDILLAGENGKLLLQARSAENPGETPALWWCQPAARECSALAGDYTQYAIDSAAFHALSGDLLLADSQQSQLVRINRSGGLVATAALELPGHPVLQLDAGLLFINSAAAPAVSVFRIEPETFGRQIDELLLMAPPALEAGQTRVLDLLRLDEGWWATLDNPESQTMGTYRFDSNWNYLGAIAELPQQPGAKLVRWKNKVLFHSPEGAVISRFTAAGASEAAFISPLLEAEITAGQRSRELQALAWRMGLLVCAAIAVFGLAYAALQWMRRSVFSSCDAQGAAPLDSALDEAKWLTNAPRRRQRLQRSSAAWLVLAFGVLLIALAAGISTLQLLALLIALCGPLLFLQTLLRSPVDHVGLLGGKFILVDHLERYHSGASSRLKQRGRFIYIDDVIVFTGSSLLPVLSRPAMEQLQALKLREISRAGWPEVLVRLRESNHPVARGGLAAVAAIALGSLGLVIGQLPL